MPVINLVETPDYIDVMMPIVEAFRSQLEEMGYDPDTDWDLCEWLVWHWLNDDD